jgi:hypothetical protein
MAERKARLPIDSSSTTRKVEIQDLTPPAYLTPPACFAAVVVGDGDRTEAGGIAR